MSLNSIILLGHLVVLESCVCFNVGQFVILTAGVKSDLFFSMYHMCRMARYLEVSEPQSNLEPFFSTARVINNFVCRKHSDFYILWDKSL